MVKKAAPKKATPKKATLAEQERRPHAGNLPDLSAAIMLRMTALNLSLTAMLLHGGPPYSIDEEVDEAVDEAVENAKFLASCYERQAQR